MVSRYEVFKGDVAVLRFKERPGALVSVAARAPGVAPPKHSFIDAQSLDAGSESTLGSLLESSKNAADFITAVRAAGFDVREVTAS